MQFSDWSNITDYGLLFHSASVLSGGLRLTDQDAENMWTCWYTCRKGYLYRWNP